MSPMGQSQPHHPWANKLKRWLFSQKKVSDLGLNKMVDILQTKLSNVFPWAKIQGWVWGQPMRRYICNGISRWLNPYSEWSLKLCRFWLQFVIKTIPHPNQCLSNSLTWYICIVPHYLYFKNDINTLLLQGVAMHACTATPIFRIHGRCLLKCTKS